MPVALGLVEARVAVLRFVDALLDAHVARDAVVLCQELVRGQKAGEAAVAVGDRVNRQEVEDEGADQDQRVGAGMALGVLVAGQELAEEELGLRGRRGSEDDLAPAVFIGDDQVLVALQVAAPGAAVGEEEPVQAQDEGNHRRANKWSV